MTRTHSFARKASMRFESGLRRHALSEVFFEQLSADVDLNSVDGRARLAERAAPALRKLPPGIFRGMMLEQLAERAKVDPRHIETMLATGEAPKITAPPKPASSQTPMRKPVRLAIALLMQQPQLATLVQNPDRLRELNVTGLELFAQLVELARAEPAMTAAGILERFRDHPDEAQLWKLAAWEHAVPEQGMEAEFEGALAWMERMQDEQRLQYLDRKLQEGELSAAELHEWQALLAQRHATPSEV